MRITGLEKRTYSLPLTPAFRATWDPEPRVRFEETVVIVDTDAGVRGFAGGAPAPDIERLESLLVGEEATDLERIARICRTVDFHHGRNWTVEVAVVDAVARHDQEPLWKMLGGSRTGISAYVSTGESLSASERVERVLEWRQQGVRALKLRFAADDWRDDVDVVAAVRDAVGRSMDIMVDANHGWRMPGDLTDPWGLSTAIECARTLAELGVYWLEEPLPTDDVEDYVRLRQQSEVRIAGGEMVRSLSQTRHLISSGAFDVVQNDVVLAGGVIGAAEVAGWAQAAGVVWSPHTWTTGLGLLANLHVALAHSTADYIEVPYDPPGWSPERRDFMLPVPLRIGGDGTISPPEGVGLGVEPDLDALELYRLA